MQYILHKCLPMILFILLFLLIYILDANNNSDGQRNIDPVEIYAASASYVHYVNMVCQTKQFCRLVENVVFIYIDN